MKLINNTSCNISAYIFNGILHLTISHKDKSWLGGTSYRGGGCLHDDGVHFEMYDDYDPTGEKLVDEDDHEKYKEFCLIPETDEETAMTDGCWYHTQNKEDEMFVCIPHPKEMYSVVDIKL